MNNFLNYNPKMIIKVLSKQLLVLVLFKFGVIVSQAQPLPVFYGEIVMEGIRDVSYSSLDLDYIGSYDDLIDTSYSYFIIDTINVVEIYRVNTTGDTTSYTYQTPDSVYYILYPSMIEKSYKPQKHISKTIVETNEYKNLLGYKCRKYNHIIHGENEIIAEIWSAVDFPYSSPFKGHEDKLSFMFKPQGIALESCGVTNLGKHASLIIKSRIVDIKPK